MKAYRELSKEELLSLKERLDRDFEVAKGKGLKLDMSRGSLPWPSWIWEWIFLMSSTQRAI